MHEKRVRERRKRKKTRKTTRKRKRDGICSSIACDASVPVHINSTPIISVVIIIQHHSAFHSILIFSLIWPACRSWTILPSCQPYLYLPSLPSPPSPFHLQCPPEYLTQWQWAKHGHRISGRLRHWSWWYCCRQTPSWPKQTPPLPREASRQQQRACRLQHTPSRPGM